jgi:hypothetical protein
MKAFLLFNGIKRYPHTTAKIIQQLAAANAFTLRLKGEQSQPNFENNGNENAPEDKLDQPLS